MITSSAKYLQQGSEKCIGNAFAKLGTAGKTVLKLANAFPMHFSQLPYF